MPSLSSLLLIAALSLLGWQAQAQVQRCTDPRTGQVTYTDGACPSHQRSVEVLPAQSAEEKAEQERIYQEAQARWQVEQERTEAARRAQAEADAAAAAAAEAARPPIIVQVPAPETAPATTSYPLLYPTYPATHTRPPKPPRPPHGRPPPPEPPTQWHCNVFRCTDDKGNVRPIP